MSMSSPVIHHDFTVERAYPQAPAKVFRGFSDPAKKRRWFAEGEGFELASYDTDFRIGGFERTRFRPVGGPPMTTDCVYLDIVENERIVFAYSMTYDGAPMSASLTTVELEPAPGGGTLLRFTEHVSFLDGKDGGAERKHGTTWLLDRLAQEIAP
jgi:uncharacterized protein YndB with AHSA1/START domain